MKKITTLSLLLLTVLLTSCGEKEAEKVEPIVEDQVIESIQEGAEVEVGTSTGEIVEEVSNVDVDNQDAAPIEEAVAPIEKAQEVEATPATITTENSTNIDTTSVNTSNQEVSEEPEEEENTDEIVEELINDIDSIFGDIESAE